MRRVAFLVQSLRLSGGHQVVVEHARQLSTRHGFDVTLVVTHHQGEEPWPFEGLSDLTVADLDDLATTSFDLAIATWWDTVRMLGRVQAKRQAYFVQSMEDRFSDEAAAERFLASLTYRLGLPVITEARWIARLLRQMDPEVPCHLVRNGINKAVFPPLSSAPVAEVGPLRVLVEGGADPIKGVGDALAAVDLMTEPLHLAMVGNPGGHVVPRGTTTHGRVPQAVLSEIYSTSDVLVKASRVEGMYGPPLEAFHRGATIVTTPVTGHEEYVEHGWNGLVTDWDDPYGMARPLDLLARDRRLLHFLRHNALATARSWPGWEQSGDLMASAVSALLGTEPAGPGTLDLAAFSEARRWAARTSDRVHHLKVKVAAEGEHIGKLEQEWARTAAALDEQRAVVDQQRAVVAAQQEQLAVLEATLSSSTLSRLARAGRGLWRRLRHGG